MTRRSEHDGRRRLVLGTTWNVVTSILCAGPILLAGAGGGIVAVTRDVLEAASADPNPGWLSTAFRVLLVGIQVLTAARIVNDYWLPRWFEIVLETGEPVRPNGFRELLLAAIPPSALTLFVVVPVIDGYSLPEGWEWLLYSGAFAVILPAALHRTIERRRFPEMRVGDSLIP